LREPPAGEVRLSRSAIERLAALHREAAALHALGELAALLDRGPTRRGRWELAREIADRLRSFEDGAWQRIRRRGGREPRNRLEELLAGIACSKLPRTRDNLYKLL
jgi:hypothetical protein